MGGGGLGRIEGVERWGGWEGEGGGGVGRVNLGGAWTISEEEEEGNGRRELG